MQITEQGAAALSEFGFDLVELDQAGAPTPGRIADRLHDIAARLQRAVRNRSPIEMVSALGELRRLRTALDAWDVGMMPQPVDGNQP